MYHPTDPNTEYIELTNVGPETINLNLVRFVDGIEFAFPSIDLSPGSYVLLVQDPVAFENRYGRGLPIAGQYTGNLSNAGERIVFQDAIGTTIHDFEFDDRWYDVTDGRGFSLTVRDPATSAPDSLGQEGAWRPSADTGGSPGFDDTGEGAAS